jgi:hypothetical protein
MYVGTYVLLYMGLLLIVGSMWPTEKQELQYAGPLCNLYSCLLFFAVYRLKEKAVG